MKRELLRPDKILRLPKWIPFWIRHATLAVALALYPIIGAAAGDIKNVYGTSSDLTITLHSVASSASFLSGSESNVIDNSSNGYSDYILGGRIRTGTSPVNGRELRIYLFSIVNDSLYPDVLDGTASSETITSVEVRDAALKQAIIIGTNDTSDRDYFFGGISVAAVFGGTVPKKWGVFFTHNTGVDTNSTSGNHVMSITPVYQNVAA